jgi:RHS repeat-associated protein
LDDEIRFYYYRTRHLDSRSGRFTSRDNIGIWEDLQNLGNGYTYVGNSPYTFTDPQGDIGWIPIVAAILIVAELAPTAALVYHGFHGEAHEEHGMPHTKREEKKAEEIQEGVKRDPKTGTSPPGGDKPPKPPEKTKPRPPDTKPKPNTKPRGWCPPRPARR